MLSAETALTDKTEAVSALNTKLADKTEPVSALNTKLADKTEAVSVLNAKLTDKTEAVSALNAKLADKTEAVSALHPSTPRLKILQKELISAFVVFADSRSVCLQEVKSSQPAAQEGIQQVGASHHHPHTPSRSISSTLQDVEPRLQDAPSKVSELCVFIVWCS